MIVDTDATDDSLFTASLLGPVGIDGVDDFWTSSSLSFAVVDVDDFLTSVVFAAESRDMGIMAEAGISLKI